MHFWFHTLTPRQWWGGSDELDKELEKRFRRELEALFVCPPASFLTDPQTALAAVLLFDQVPRNIFRGTPRAFATDSLARTITHGALERGFLARLQLAQRQFLLMPLMHSEAIADHRLALPLFARVNNGEALPFARSHARMIARFGRYPHRNAVLGRESTPAEERAIKAGFAW
ncbi:DUF924 family protein [Aurantiacibacter poecillastricola]|uniref:DUF924 family protein n=1 Tax=Aurantiacibacter poecillastricola TaxID=3064385 RepID=UPI00273F6A49|nr:DUF924 family protein [Aurantiacibacter sp. 219JJ12-13]MDP5260805.1 DUF924 family protein [Aurantiacibacter sp. 219JJ12-13]